MSDKLLRELLPGPVTVVFERTAALNPSLNPGSSTIGIRVPASGFVCDVARQCGEPLALTSANVSAQPSSLTIEVFIMYILCEVLISFFHLKIHSFIHSLSSS